MRRGLATVALVALTGTTLLSGCSDDTADKAVDRTKEAVSSAAGNLDEVDLPEVDWSKYGDQVKKRIDQWATDADCSRLKDELGRSADDTDLTAYIKAKIKEAC